MLGLLAFLDLEFSAQFSISTGVLFLAPVLFATRRLGLEIGIATVFIAATLIGVAELWQAKDLARGAIIYNASVHGVFMLTSVVLLGWLQRSQERLLGLASTDALTGIANRRALMQVADIELRRQSRTFQPLSVVHIDLDNFKKLNDTHGHAEGDRLLAAVGETLAKGRVTDTAARLGGDEFALLLPDTGPQQASVMVERLRERLGALLVSNQRWSQVSLSIGIATFMQPALDSAQLIAAADQMMYDIKRSNKNGVKQIVIDGEHTTELLRTAGRQSIRA